MQVFLEARADLAGPRTREERLPCPCSLSLFLFFFFFLWLLSFLLSLSVFLFILNSDSFRTVYAQESRPETRREPRLEHAISLHDPRYTGSSPLRRGRTLLHAAGHRGFLECLKALINARETLSGPRTARERESSQALCRLLTLVAV